MLVILQQEVCITALKCSRFVLLAGAPTSRAGRDKPSCTAQVATESTALDQRMYVSLIGGDTAGRPANQYFYDIVGAKGSHLQLSNS